MKTVFILVPKNSVIQAIADPQYCFSAVNSFMQVSGRPVLFDVQLVGVEAEVRLNEGRYSVYPDQLTAHAGVPDIIIIPALFGNMKEAIDANKDLIPWILDCHAKGSEVASLCVGAFLLASTGLLKGKSCSTHWGFANEFRTMFPDVEVADGSIITEIQGIYSSGGANSYWNLLLHLVEKYTDRETAILASKYFAIDIDRNNQSAFAIFRGQKSHADDSVRQAQEYIEENIGEKMTIDDLADRFCIGRRSFERRFKKATGNSVLEYIQRVRVEAAKKRFETSLQQVSEVIYDVGYTDTKSFRMAFRKITGLTPLEYRNKYNKAPAL